MSKNDFPVIGIGASAGGVEALTALFSHLPPQPKAAFVVVTHLAPGRQSLLPQILAGATSMPTVAAADGQELEPGHICLNTPDTVLTVQDRRLWTAPRRRERNPIDVFLATLALDLGERAIAVILSGAGADGALGVKTVREAGGFTLAQGQDSHGMPEYSGMPQAAVATGFVDEVLPVGDIPRRIADYVVRLTGGDAALTRLKRGGPASVEPAKTAIYAVLRRHTGHDFSGYKDKTFLRRVERCMHVRQAADLAGYVAIIQSDPQEAEALFRDLLIGVTGFFRDAPGVRAAGRAGRPAPARRKRRRRQRPGVGSGLRDRGGGLFHRDVAAGADGRARGEAAAPDFRHRSRRERPWRGPAGPLSRRPAGSGVARTPGAVFQRRRRQRDHRSGNPRILPVFGP